MNSLPTELSNIVNGMKIELEVAERFKKVMKQVREVPYYFEPGEEESQRCYKNKTRTRTITNYSYYDVWEKSNVIVTSEYIEEYRNEYEIITSLVEKVNKIEIKVSKIF